jgi:predicted nucleic acid-binding protein
MLIPRLRQTLSRLLLRGPLRAWWLRRKSLQVEALCLARMAAAGATPPAEARPPAPPPRPPLRKLLFIADILWEAAELVPELEKIAAVETLDLRPALRAVPEGEATAPAVARALATFLREPRAQGADAVLLYAAGAHLSDVAFALLRQACPGPLIGMNLDDKVQFWHYPPYRGGGHHYRRWVTRFDLNLTNSKIAAGWYRDAGAACLFMPPAMRAPRGVGRPAAADFKHQLSFVGSPKPDREILVARLRAAGLPVTLFGRGWPDSRWEPDTVAIYRASQLNLGFGLATPNLATLKNRDFECPGSGACYLTSYNWELAEWWDIGREILCYRNAEELIEIVSWYRNRPQDCLAIAQAAWDRAAREHTWEIRFRAIFTRLGFRLPTA